MKLSELKVLEAALETKTAEDLWSELSGDSAEYVSTSTYQVREVPDSKPVQYEAFEVVPGLTRKPYGTFSAAELAKTLQPIRPNQTPDAEGFTIYTDPDKVEAVKYTGDPIKLDLDGKQTVQLRRDDYLVRSVDGSSFKFSTETARTFDATLRKA